MTSLVKWESDLVERKSSLDNQDKALITRESQFAEQQVDVERRQVMVTDLSHEGIGLVNRGRIKSDFIAMLLSPRAERTIQVFVRIVRHVHLKDTYYVVGGEFHLRLGGGG